MSILIKNAQLSGKSTQDILIQEDCIHAVDSHISAQAHTVIEAAGNLVIPGFVDAHMHLDKCLLTERAPYLDLSGPEKGARTRQEKERLSVDAITYNARRVIEKCIEFGSLALRTNVDVDPIIELKGIEALCALREEYRENILLQVVAFAQEGFEKYPETEGLLRSALEMGSDAVGGHTIVDQNGREHIDRIFRLAKEFDVNCEFHVDESGQAQHFLLPYLAGKTKEFGWEERVNAIHACSLSAVEAEQAQPTIQRVREAGIRVIVAPTAISTRKLTLVKELLAAKVPVCLGSDNIGDFFNPLGSGNMLHVAYLLTYIQRFFTDEDLRQVFHMISNAGAQVLSLESEFSIQQNAVAHVTVLDGKSPKDVLVQMKPPLSVIRTGKPLCGLGTVSSET